MLRVEYKNRAKTKWIKIIKCQLQLFKHTMNALHLTRTRCIDAVNKMCVFFFRCYSAQLSSFVLLYNFLDYFNNTRDTITDTNPTDVNDILHLNISISHQKCRKENFNNIVTKQFISREREREINEGLHVPIESVLCC